MPGVPRGLTGAALAVLPQLVIAAAPALVLGQRHLHAVVLAAAVVQGARVHRCGGKGQEIHWEMPCRLARLFSKGKAKLTHL